MKYIVSIILFFSLFFSCSSKKQLTYISDFKKNNAWNINKLKQQQQLIQIGDILKIVVSSSMPEAVIAYNRSSSIAAAQNIDLIKLDGYVVDDEFNILFPVLGKISTANMTTTDLESKITELLIEGDFLNSAIVEIKMINSKFTVLGEVRNPGTFNYFDRSINLFQALGYAGDLTIDGKRSDLTIIRTTNEIKKVSQISLNKSEILDSDLFYIKNNDIIIVNPSFSKSKSAGFIGSPQSIASFASLIVSITLLILNNN